MKASIYYEKGDIRYEEISVPEIGDGEILMEMEACGLCGTDIHKALDGTVKGPVVLGHEAVGKIVKKGKNTDRFNIGDRIITAIHVPCFTCHYCNKGQYTLCGQFKNTNIEPGGFAEYIRIPEEHVKHLVHIVPDGVSVEEATLAEPVACCIHGLKAADIQIIKKVWIGAAIENRVCMCGSKISGILLTRWQAQTGCNPNHPHAWRKRECSECRSMLQRGFTECIAQEIRVGVV